MNFSNNESVYIQIAQDIYRQILIKELKPGDVIDSVRVLAKTYQVTPKTIQNATNYLVDLEILVKRQGVGMMVTSDTEIIEKVKQFYIKDLKKELELNLSRMGITLDEFLSDEE